MAKQFDEIDAGQQKFIEEQHMFFVGSAAEAGQVNISPKGMDALRVLGQNRIVWRNLTGSGNETAGHLKRVNRMTLMWCSYTTRPMIMRCFGTAKTIHPRDADWDELNGLFAPAINARQIYDMHVDIVQTSCGYAVPFMDFVKDRDTLTKWAADKGEANIETFWEERNQVTIDGYPTDVVSKSE